MSIIVYIANKDGLGRAWVKLGYLPKLAWLHRNDQTLWCLVLCFYCQSIFCSIPSYWLSPHLGTPGACHRLYFGGPRTWEMVEKAMRSCYLGYCWEFDDGFIDLVLVHPNSSHILTTQIHSWLINTYHTKDAKPTLTAFFPKIGMPILVSFTFFARRQRPSEMKVSLNFFRRSARLETAGTRRDWSKMAAWQQKRWQQTGGSQPVNCRLLGLAKISGRCSSPLVPVRTAQVTSMLRKEQEEEARLAEKLQEQKYQSEAQDWQLGGMIQLYFHVFSMKISLRFFKSKGP